MIADIKNYQKIDKNYWNYPGFQNQLPKSIDSCILNLCSFKGNLKHILPEQMMRGMVGFYLVCVTFVSDSVGGRRIGRS